MLFETIWLQRRPCYALSDGILHVKIDVADSESQLLYIGAFASIEVCNKVCVKSVLMHRLRTFFHKCLPDICANITTLPLKVVDREDISVEFHYLTVEDPKWGDGVKLTELILVSLKSPYPLAVY